MFDADSPFFNLPNLPRRELILIDGVRHSVEMAAVALARLQDQLTELSLGQESGPISSRTYALAFVDAWATVSAIDRFHAIYRNLLASDKATGSADRSIQELTAVRNLRNVDQHISSRVDYVVANKGTALGILRWSTFAPPDYSTFIKGILLPGTEFSSKIKFPFDAGRFQGEQTHPTPEIVLEAGEFSADLVASMKLVYSVSKDLEEQLAKNLQGIRDPGRTLQSDRFHAVRFVPVASAQNPPGG